MYGERMVMAMEEVRFYRFQEEVYTFAENMTEADAILLAENMTEDDWNYLYAMAEDVPAYKFFLAQLGKLGSLASSAFKGGMRTAGPKANWFGKVGKGISNVGKLGAGLARKAWGTKGGPGIMKVLDPKQSVLRKAKAQKNKGLGAFSGGNIVGKGGAEMRPMGGQMMSEV